MYRVLLRNWDSITDLFFLSVAIRFAKQLNVPNAHVMKFSGLSKTDEYELKDNEVVRTDGQPKEVSE